MGVQLREYTENYWTVDFTRVNFMVCELYLHKAAIKKLTDFLVLMTKQIKISVWCWDLPCVLLVGTVFEPWIYWPKCY